MTLILQIFAGTLPLLIAVVWNAIKVDRLEARIDRLDARIDSLNTRIDTLTVKVSDLAERVAKIEGKIEGHHVVLEN